MFSDMDPLARSQWSTARTVAGFAQAAPNDVLMAFGEEELRRAGTGRALDLGCGAGRNLVPLARLGWSVVGTDLSWPMLVAAAARTREDRLNNHLHLILAPMDSIPARDRSFDAEYLPPQMEPVAGEPFVFTPFSGEPQCFLTEAQLVAELGDVGFTPEPRVPLREYNRRQPGALSAGTLPVIYEAAFRRT